MNSRLSLATGLMWLALPLTALDYWLVWDRLPARMATHFDADWRANGWASREGSLEFALLVVLFMLAVFTIINFAMWRSSVPQFARWLMLAFSYGVLIVVCSVNHRVLRYNLGERRKGPSQVQNVLLHNFAKRERGSPLLEQLRSES